jgi:hypothetical protein
MSGVEVAEVINVLVAIERSAVDVASVSCVDVAAGITAS